MFSIIAPTVDDDLWAEAWLDRTYGGAPDECASCYRNGKLVKIEDCKDPDHSSL